MGSTNDKDKITLETLLQLKRNERPGSDFWEDFEQDFQRRRLRALVEPATYRDAIWRPSLRAFAFGLPTLLLAGLAFYLSQAGAPPAGDALAVSAVPMLDTHARADAAEAVAPEERPAFPQTSLASSQFVLDAIEANPSRQVSFEKVMYTPAIRLSVPSGASYVRDSLSTGNYQVTTADIRLGRNF